MLSPALQRWGLLSSTIHELASDKILPELTARYCGADFLSDTHEYDGLSVLKCGPGFLVIY